MGPVSVTFKQATHAEIHWLTDVFVESLRDAIARARGEWREERERSQFRDQLTLAATFTIHYGERAIGFYSAHREGNALVLHTLCIRPEFQGRGHGSAALRALLVKEGSATEVRLSVLKSNPRARAFYERHGFHVRSSTALHDTFTCSMLPGGVLYRPATADDATAAAALIAESFLSLAADDWEPEARERFVGEASADRLRERLPLAAYAGCALAGDVLAGFIMLPKPTHVGLLFVSPAAVGRGIGRGLWERARAAVEERYPDTGTIELNATPYSVPFYRAQGFVTLSGEFTLRGCRATRMALWLPARRLGAEIE